MAGFSLTDSGSPRTEDFLKNLAAGGDLSKDLDKYGQMGVDALAKATPRLTGTTARSWAYGIDSDGGAARLYWYNTNVNNGEVIALLIQYGHGTGTGGWVSGYDYINPALRPVFDRIAEELWKKVSNG